MSIPQILDRWFALADADRDGVVAGGEAVAFFSKASLPKETLAQVTTIPRLLCQRSAPRP